MKRPILVKFVPLLLICLWAPSLLNAQKYEWAKSAGGTVLDNGQSIQVDAWGNVYTTGLFQGTVDFDPGTGTHNLTSGGGYDIFVLKMDSTGKFLWARSFGGAQDDNGVSLSVDSRGNVFTTGKFHGTVDFDPGTGVVNLNTGGLGISDVFVQKMDSSGKFLWVRSFGGNGDDEGKSICIDAWGNIYTTGTFKGKVDFNPGLDTAFRSSVGNDDVFIQKMDSSGNFLWVKSFGGISLDQGNSISTDSWGNVYTTGTYRLIVDFDPDTSTYNLYSSGFTDIFVHKMDSSGKFLWARSMGGNGYDVGQSLGIDASGNVYITGWFSDTADFDPGLGTNKLISLPSGSGFTDIYVQKMDSSGKFLWARSFEGKIHHDRGNALSIDTSGNVYTTGYFRNVVDFDPAPNDTFLLTASAINEAFVQKMDSSGKFQWARSFGSTGTNSSYGNAICVDASGNVYTTGGFYGNADFDPGPGTDYLISLGVGDIFVQKLSECDPLLATDTIVSCDSYKWIDGKTYTSSNGTATHTLINNLGCDSVVTLNLIINSSNTGTDVISACDRYTWMDGKTYYTSNNNATHTLTNAAGCDSVVTLNLRIDRSYTSTDVISACDSYTWIDGKTYTTSNQTATDTLSTIAGCDSIVTLNLTINHPNSGTDVISACDRYTWIDGKTYTTSNNTAQDTLINVAGCDSVVTLNLTINPSLTSTDVISACDSYTWIDGNTYTTSNNTAADTFTTVMGCDSIIRLDLTINTVNSSVTQTGALLSSNESGASYQWLNCPEKTAIVGATNQTYSAIANGDYAVEVTVNSCTDTSACFTITGVGIIESDFEVDLMLYPNPTHGNFTLDLGRNHQEVVITISDLNGKMIQAKRYEGSQVLNLSLDEPAGVYLLRIEAGEEKAIIRLVKE